MEASRVQFVSTVPYRTVPYCAVLYCTVLYYCHGVKTQLQITNISIYTTSVRRDASRRLDTRALCPYCCQREYTAQREQYQ